VGHASAAEIDEVGIIAALRRAGLRALAALPVRPDAVLLDGSHDWLTRPGQASLLDLFEAAEAAVAVPPVTTRVKADLTCASVAAASVLAKTERDEIMRTLADRHPQYGWAHNKGYASPDHLEALREHGPCAEHRRSWRLPG
jgi:ribonuclease HII